MAKAIARVASSTTNEPDFGTIRASATRMTATIRILTRWVPMDRSISPEKARGLDRKNQNHGRVQCEVGDLRKQGFAEIVGETDRERADRGATQAAHATDNHHGECQG